MRLLSHPLIYKAILVLSALVAAVQAARFAGLMSKGKGAKLTDFDAFHIAGRMGLNGEMDKAYSFIAYFARQQEAGGGDSFMPWTYPPQFDLLVTPLAAFDIATAYLIFTGCSLIAYVAIIFRIAGEGARAVLCAICPTLFLTIVCGQNGFLTGALLGLACLLFMARAPAAGAPLGLMTMKPHLGVTFAVYTIATMNWRVFVIAAAVAAAYALAATAAFGVQIWTAFAAGVAEAGVFLKAGLYPLHRMISAYALLRSFGAPAPVAFAAQAIVALAAITLVVIAVRQKMPQRDALGLTALLGLLVSPYAYDYDLPIFGVALALLLPTLARRASAREQIAIVLLSWGASFWGLALSRILQFADIERAPGNALGASMGGLFMMLIVWTIWRVLQRDRRARAVPAGGPAQLQEASLQAATS